MEIERIMEIDGRCDNAFIILATMMIGSAAVCCCGTAIPEQLLLSAVITTICGLFGVIGISFIRMFNALNTLGNI